RRDAQAELADPLRRPPAVRRRAAPAAGDREERSELVRLPAHGARGRAVHARAADRAPRGPEDRDAAALRREPDAAAGIRRDRVPDGRRPAEQRRRHGALVLDRRLPRADRGDAGLRRLRVRPVPRPVKAATYFGERVAGYDAY